MRRREPPRGRQRLAPLPLAQLGALLRQERERRGLSAAQVASAIRFAERHVVALEEGRGDELPPRPYDRGILVAYAQLLGFDASGLRDPQRKAPAQPGGGRRPGRPRHPRGFNWRDWALPIVCACAAAGYVVLRLALAPPLPEASPPPPPAPAPVSRPDAEPPAETAPVAAEEPPAPAAAGVRVLLRSEGTTWAEYASDGGERRRVDLLPGRSLEIAGQQRVSLALGDAGVVRVRVNERELGFIGDKGETKVGLSFTPPVLPAPTKAAPAAGD